MMFFTIGAYAMEVAKLVSNEKMASRLAEVYVAEIYGAAAAEQQKPYKVVEKEAHWEIFGVMKGVRLGGTFEIHISKDDGRVLYLRHSR